MHISQAMSDVQYQTALALFGQGRHDEGSRMLAQAASAGHVPSMSLLGGQLLSGRGMAPDWATGARLILRAAEFGGGYACAMASTLFAHGHAGQPDWPRALDYLQRAAELGFQPARDQLRLLSGYKAGIDWKKLRRAIDIAAWRKIPTPFTLNEDPPVHAVPGLLSAELCDALIARASPLIAPAPVYDEQSGGNTTSNERPHSAAIFQVVDMDLVTEAIVDRVCALAGMPATHAEPLQVLHYKVGEYFVPHFDAWDHAIESHAATLKTHGQRVFTVVVYLNDDLEGGETEFLHLGLRHRGKKGDALMWRNVDAEGRRDRRTRHAGRPPTQGEKWLLSLWILDRATPECSHPGLKAAMAGP